MISDLLLNNPVGEEKKVREKKRGYELITIETGYGVCLCENSIDYSLCFGVCLKNYLKKKL